MLSNKLLKIFKIQSLILSNLEATVKVSVYSNNQINTQETKCGSNLTSREEEAVLI